jgi:hypothetical protein
MIFLRGSGIASIFEESVSIASILQGTKAAYYIIALTT